MTDTSLCRYECEYYNSINSVDKVSFTLENNSPIKEGSFSVDLSTGQNSVSGFFYVSCTRKGWGGLCISEITNRQEPFLTNDYGHNGDGTCQERFEDCSSAIDDCGKCDGVACVSDSQCEGGYCIHEKCSSKSYVERDSYCDSIKGENCKNSVIDCGCENNERCGSNAKCETYCGNGVCEKKESGVCKADCIWCGDGTCNSNENCDICSLDCGNCKKMKTEITSDFKTLNSKTSSITGNVVSENSQLEDKNPIKVIILITIALLLLLVLIYLSRKYYKNLNE